jgi:hypothetical protein
MLSKLSLPAIGNTLKQLLWSLLQRLSQARSFSHTIGRFAYQSALTLRLA